MSLPNSENHTDSTLKSRNEAVSMSGSHALRPMHFRESCWYFGLPALLFVIVRYGFSAPLEVAGLTPFMVLSITSMLMFFVLSLATVIVLYKEDQLSHCINRLRLKRIRWSHTGWALASIVVAILAAQLMMPLTAYLVENGWIPLPNTIPAMLDPRLEQNLENMQTMMGREARGNLTIALFIPVLLIFNTLSEEIWWRGIVLPRQELAFGQKAWIIHGIMWTSFHAAQYWTLLILLPFCLALSWSAQRTQSCWPGIMSHFVINSLGFIPIYFLIF